MIRKIDTHLKRSRLRRARRRLPAPPPPRLRRLDAPLGAGPARLARARRAVAIDLHGFGWTERPSDPAAYTLEGQERMVLGVADQLGFERFDLAGHSYGGAIALFIASRHPERVRSLVLVDNAMPEYAALRRSKRYGNRGIARLFVRTVGLRSARVRYGLEESYADDRKVSDELVRDYLERLRVEGVEDAFDGLTAPLASERG